ncbi:uncharacterized protein LOC128282632 [Gossypium arboreum]|uniref:uncharacterized protein LOC128282632 n=1 Tax=Gossypium arboreum TaxID=29729 RepID=UPI0022F14E3C|nr:uncharacterized protein LOC128282632 [Gossypium arboreum]
MGVIIQFNCCKEKVDMLIWTKVKDRLYTRKALCSLVSSGKNQMAKLWKLVWVKLAPRTWNSSFGYWCRVELLLNLSYPREIKERGNWNWIGGNLKLSNSCPGSFVFVRDFGS